MPDEPRFAIDGVPGSKCASSPVQRLLDDALLLDLETGADGAVHKIGAARGGPGGGREFRREGRFDLGRALAELTAFAGEARYVIGHNLLGHDLPTLRALAPALSLLARPVIDTLYISPLAFPQNPYHRLVKDYKLVRDSLADPVADCWLAERVLREQFDELARRAAAAADANEADLIAVYRFCFQGATLLDGNATGGDGIAAVFRLLAPSLPTVQQVRDSLLARWQGRACITAAPRLILGHLKDPDLRPALAYAAAWLTVAGGNSVLPPWVRQRFPATLRLLDRLREVPCGEPECIWCREAHDPMVQLRRWFGFDGFRPLPATPDGASLQQAVVTDGIAGRPLLAILPTGGGKSLCFQLPALVRYVRRGTLTVVISPLQALMKDQVDNLVRKTGATNAAALYGLLTPPERGDVMERVRLGDVAILYLSPEQLRNRSVADTLASREIGCWVFDEAHCLSKWGHDFRPDYLYASRFIRTLAERQQLPVPPVTCVTATAKQDVTREILAHFRDELGLDLALFEGGVERDNLAFEVQLAGKHEKDARIHAILTEHLRGPAAPTGAAIVYASRRKRTEDLAERLQREGWAVEAFHAGLEAPDKKRIQDAFIHGELTVICATNAFGMGVDKEDVRLVIHADVPASLENYIQEAGRAGRDRAPALCVLLYDQQDIEAQFGMEARSELTRRDIAEILHGLRRAKPNRDGDVVVTAAELLRDEDLRLGFDPEARDADTRVRIAVSWLERAGLVQRDANRTGVFQGRPAVPDLAAAARKIAGLNLSAAQRARWLAILEVLLNTEPDESLTADDLARLPACKEQPGAAWDRGQTPAQRVLRTLHDMANAGLLSEGPQLTAFVRHKVRDSSQRILDRVAALERAMLDALREAAPDAEPGAWQPLSLRRLNQHLLDQGHADSNPETLRALLKGLSLDGRGLAGARGSLDLKQVDRDHYRVRLHRDWPTLTRTAERRRAVAQLILKTLLAKLPADTPAGADLLLHFGTDELTRAIADDLMLAGQVQDRLAAVDRGLMFLHEHGAIILHHGLAVFRSAMTIRVLPEAKRRRYTTAQHQPLAQHYGERVFQIHVMDRYARLGAEKIRQALALVAGYFSLGKEDFVRRFFGDKREMLTRATTAESFARIVDALRNPRQTEVVAAPEDGNRLVLAGPGAGKTRVIVHRCAYLLRVLRVPAHRILVLCFNRAAALELRRRLAALVGDEARHVTVQTYHGFAMRLTGHSYAERMAAAADQPLDFDAVLTEAVALLEGRRDLPGVEPDGARERLLAGYRHILVDEYQDIDADQYRLVSAIAGRTLGQDGDDAKLTLLAVGDDDQNIYGFRGASVEYIRKFQADYDAELHYLVENYRSSAHIIAAANALIGHNRARMKRDQPIRIDRARAQQPAGGCWAQLDPHTRGRVLVPRVSDPGRQAAAIVERIQTLHRLGGGSWRDFAVLARRHAVLEPVRALCEHAGIPVRSSGELPPLHRVREIHAFLAALKARGREPLRPDELGALLPAQPSPWRDLLADLIADWRAELGGAPAEAPVEPPAADSLAVPAGEIAEFFWETLAEQRREQRVGDGVLLATLHAAKGLEFPHVLIADGGWAGGGATAQVLRRQGAEPDAAARERDEDERRAFYVGMTRARETLTLLEIAGAGHPHLPLLAQAHTAGDWLLHDAPVISPPPAALIARRYTQLTLADLDLGYAGRQPPNAPIHRHLAALHPGTTLGWRPLGAPASCRPGGPQGAEGSASETEAGQLLLTTPEGDPVARLSKRAAAHWLPRAERIEAIRVLALIRRDRAQTEPDYAAGLRCDAWEVPLVEIRWQDG